MSIIEGLKSFLGFSTKDKVIEDDPCECEGMVNFSLVNELQRIYSYNPKTIKIMIPTECPDCGNPFNRKPIRGITCSKCKKKFYVKIDPETKIKTLVGTETLPSIEKKWRLRDYILYVLLEHCKAAITIDLVHKIIKTPYSQRVWDILWSFLNELILHSKNAHQLLIIYYLQAQLLLHENSDKVKEAFEIMRDCIKLIVKIPRRRHCLKFLYFVLELFDELRQRKVNFNQTQYEEIVYKAAGLLLLEFVHPLDLSNVGWRQDKWGDLPPGFLYYLDELLDPTLVYEEARKLVLLQKYIDKNGSANKKL